MLYGCKTWILTEALIKKLEICENKYARTCNHIIMGIQQSRNHVTNQSLYQITDQVKIRERQLKFTGHCIRMPTDEPALLSVGFV